MNTLSQPINNRLNRNPPISQPRANPPILRRNVVMNDNALLFLNETVPGGVRRICNEHCNPQCPWNETTKSFDNPSPIYYPKDSNLDDGCKQLCRNETCEGLGAATRDQIFKSVVEKAAEAVPVLKHFTAARSLGGIATDVYNRYGDVFTGTPADAQEAANRERRERDPRNSPDFVVNKQPEYSMSVITQQPTRTRGGTRHRRAKSTRHQKKKQRRKSRKHKRTKHRNSGRKRKATKRR